MVRILQKFPKPSVRGLKVWVPTRNCTTPNSFPSSSRKKKVIVVQTKNLIRSHLSRGSPRTLHRQVRGWGPFSHEFDRIYNPINSEDPFSYPVKIYDFVFFMLLKTELILVGHTPYKISSMILFQITISELQSYVLGIINDP